MSDLLEEVQPELAHLEEQDLCKQSLLAEEEFQRLLETHEEDRKSRFIKNRPGIGHRLFTQEDVLAQQQAFQQSISRQQESFREQVSEPVLAVPADYTQPQYPYILEYEDQQDYAVVKAEDAVDEPNYAPVGRSLLKKRQANLDLLRRAVNVIIMQIRARKSLERIQQAFSLRRPDSDKTVEILEKIVDGDVTELNVQRMMALKKQTNVEAVEEELGIKVGTASLWEQRNPIVCNEAPAEAVDTAFAYVPADFYRGGSLEIGKLYELSDAEQEFW